MVQSRHLSTRAERRASKFHRPLGCGGRHHGFNLKCLRPIRRGKLSKVLAESSESTRANIVVPAAPPLSEIALSSRVVSKSGFGSVW